MAALGSFNGGVIACHEVEPDQPWENIAAVLRTFKLEGHYPLRWEWNGTRAVPRREADTGARLPSRLRSK